MVDPFNRDVLRFEEESECNDFVDDNDYRWDEPDDIVEVCVRELESLSSVKTKEIQFHFEDEHGMEVQTIVGRYEARLYGFDHHWRVWFFGYNQTVQVIEQDAGTKDKARDIINQHFSDMITGELR